MGDKEFNELSVDNLDKVAGGHMPGNALSAAASILAMPHTNAAIADMRIRMLQSLRLGIITVGVSNLRTSWRICNE